ncbi:MAG: hypothetical protein AAGA58_15375 [Verrucomicrobiota bacterium]
MMTKSLMSVTVLLLLVALFISLRNHSELNRALEENGRLRGELAQTQGNPDYEELALEENKRLRAEMTNLQNDRQQAVSNMEFLQTELARKETELAVKSEETEMIRQGAEVTETELTDEQRKIRDLPEIGEVVEANSEWNVVRINAGAGQNLSGGITLAVRRGHYIIGDLKIEEVDENSSIGSMITKTLRPGMTVRLGDSVLPYPLY